MERQAGNGNATAGPPPEENKGPDGRSGSRRSTRFKEENEYVEVTLDVGADDAVAVQSVRAAGETPEAALLPRGGGLSSRLKAELRRIASAKRGDAPVSQRRLDRSMTGAARALRGLHFLNQSVVTQGSWPEVEKRFDRLAVDGLLLRSRFGQCIGKLARSFTCSCRLQLAPHPFL